MLVDILRQFMDTEYVSLPIEYVSLPINVYSSEFVLLLTHPLSKDLSNVCYVYAMIQSIINGECAKYKQNNESDRVCS